MRTMVSRAAWRQRRIVHSLNHPTTGRPLVACIAVAGPRWHCHASRSAVVRSGPEEDRSPPHRPGRPRAPDGYVICAPRDDDHAALAAAKKTATTSQSRSSADIWSERRRRDSPPAQLRPCREETSYAHTLLAGLHAHEGEVAWKHGLSPFPAESSPPPPRSLTGHGR